MHAQWLGRWCTSLVAQVRLLECPVQRQLLQGETPKDAAATYHVFVYYMHHACSQGAVKEWNEMTLTGSMDTYVSQG